VLVIANEVKQSMFLEALKFNFYGNKHTMNTPTESTNPINTFVHQDYLITVMLKALIVIFLSSAIINLFFTNYIHNAITQFIATIILAGLYLYFKKSKNIPFTSTAILFLLGFVIILFFHSVEQYYYSFVWISVFIPIVFFLKGIKRSISYLTLYFGYIFYFIISHASQWEVNGYMWESTANVITSSIAMVLIIVYYEHSRQNVFDKLQLKINLLNRLSAIDVLTGLCNRLRLEELLENEIERAKRYNHHFSIIIIDVDHFKEINDAYGNQIGDEVLIVLAQILEKAFRNTDTVGRWSGDKFLVICPQTNSDESIIVAEQVRKEVANFKHYRVGYITVSLGVTTCINHDNTSKVLISQAEEVLLSAKQNGRNRVGYYYGNH